MLRSSLRVMWVIALVGILSGCVNERYWQVDQSRAGGVADVLADQFLPADTHSMRVLRAELFLGVIAYAGLKRIERSRNTANYRAEAFLLRIKGAQSVLAEAARAASTNGPFQIYMVEVVDELAEMTKIAVEFDQSSIADFSDLLSGDPAGRLKTAGKLLKKGAQVVRHGRAILVDIAVLRSKMIKDLNLPCAADKKTKKEKRNEEGQCVDYDWSKAEPKKEHWDYVMGILKFSCDILGQHAQLPASRDAFDTYCKWNGPVVAKP